MKHRLLLPLVPVVAIGCMGSGAEAGWDYGPPCPSTSYWHMSRKAYAEWQEFKLFNGSWGEKHKVVRRHRIPGIVVKVWSPDYAGWCRYD